MSILIFERSLPDEIILNICHYLSWFDIMIAFYNLNTRLNRTISGYYKNIFIGNNCQLKHFQYGCSLLLSHRSSLFFHIRTLTISNQGSPLAGKYFLLHIPIQEMIYLEKLTLIAFTGDEILSYLNAIENAGDNVFQHLVELRIYDPPYINSPGLNMHSNSEAAGEYMSNLTNRMLTGNNQQLQSIIFSGNDVFMETNLKLIQDPCINLHTLSIVMENVDELILLFALIPNIRCLHVGLRNTTPLFGSLLRSSVLLPYLIEFHLYAELTLDWTMDQLVILLHLMPAVQRLVLHISTFDARLLDGRQIQVALSTVNISHLDSFGYGVQYLGPQLDHNIINNLQETWLPQPIAHTFDAEGEFLSLHTIPCIFRKFWLRNLPDKMERSRLEQKPVSYYGDSAYITHCYANVPCNRELSTIIQRSSRVESLRICLLDKRWKEIVEPEEELMVFLPSKQQFHLTSLRLVGDYYNNVHLIQLLIICGSHLRKLTIDLRCLLNLVNDVENNTQFKASISHRNLVYLDLDNIDVSEVNSGAFRRVIDFLFDNNKNLRHITLVLMWNFELFGSSDDLIMLMEMLCSFKHCKLLTSIVIYHCLFSNKFNDNNQYFHQWLNDNTHLTYEHHFDIECDQKHMTLKLWLK